MIEQRTTRAPRPRALLGRAGLVLALACPVAWGCRGSQAPLKTTPEREPAPTATPVASDTLLVRVNETVNPVFGGVQLGFLGVPSDSRCPKDVTCVWAGEARLHFVLLQPDKDSVYVTAVLGGASGRLGPPANPVDTLGYRLSVLELEPYPISKSTIRPSDYRARLTITKL